MKRGYQRFPSSGLSRMHLWWAGPQITRPWQTCAQKHGSMGGPSCMLMPRYVVPLFSYSFSGSRMEEITNVCAVLVGRASCIWDLVLSSSTLSRIQLCKGRSRGHVLASHSLNLHAHCLKGSKWRSKEGDSECDDVNSVIGSNYAR